MSSGAATDGVTLFSSKKTDDLFSPSLLESDDLFSRRLLLTTTGVTPWRVSPGLSASPAPSPPLP